MTTPLIHLNKQASKKQAKVFLYWILLRMIVPIVSVAIVACIVSIMHSTRSNQFPIHKVRVYGVHHIDYHQIQNILTPLVQKGFFNINIHFIRDQLLQLPWVSDIAVRRVWPDRLEITLIEKEAVAWWNRQSLLSQTGELFSLQSNRLMQQLRIPVFIGPSGQHIIMLKYYNQMNQLLSIKGLHIHSLELTPSIDWKLGLDNGMVIILPDCPEGWDRMQTFMHVYSKMIQQQAASIVSVDLRYPHGIAVRWRKEITLGTQI